MTESFVTPRAIRQDKSPAEVSFVCRPWLRFSEVAALVGGYSGKHAGNSVRKAWERIGLPKVSRGRFFVVRAEDVPKFNAHFAGGGHVDAGDGGRGRGAVRRGAVAVGALHGRRAGAVAGVGRVGVNETGRIGG